MADFDGNEAKAAHEPSAAVESVVWALLSPDGWEPIWVAWTSRGLREIRWHAPSAEIVGRLPAAYEQALLAYFGGEAVEFDGVPIDPVGTPFQRRVWEALRKVRRGTVRTYAGIAADVGSPRATRAVGAANAANPLPIVVPCHRIVEVGLKLGGYSGGLERKRRLLELEGVRFSGDLVQPGQLPLL